LTVGSAAASHTPPAPRGALGARLYQAIVRRNLKIGEIAYSWDTNRSGTIEPREFRDQVLALVPDADVTEANALFASLDSDGGGCLDTEELKMALKRLQGQAEKAGKEEAELSTEAHARRRAAMEKQETVRKQAAEDKLEEEAREAAEKQARALQQAARSKAKEEAKAAKVEKQLLAAEEKRTFEQRVAAKRASARGAVPVTMKGSQTKADAQEAHQASEPARDLQKL